MTNALQLIYSSQLEIWCNKTNYSSTTATYDG